MDYVNFYNLELDKCPHCGSWAKIKQDKKTSKYFIECNRCHVKTKELCDYHECVSLWKLGYIMLPVEEN